MSRIVHAGLIARWTPTAGWRGVLIEGPSGAGKSDLALRALNQGFRLVADDRVVLWSSGGMLFGRAPEVLSGALEVRGLAVIGVPALGLAPIVLVAQARPPEGEAERIPRPAHVERAGVRAPAITLDLRESSAPAKLSRALDLFDEASKRRI